jgi:hypothetical protein
MKTESKECSKCKDVLTLDNFPIHKAYKGGHSCICKKCVYEYNKERRSNPIVREHMNKNARLWLKNTPEKTEQRRIRTYVHYLQIRGYEIRKDGFILVN